MGPQRSALMIALVPFVGFCCEQTASNISMAAGSRGHSPCLAASLRAYRQHAFPRKLQLQLFAIAEIH